VDEGGKPRLVSNVSWVQEVMNAADVSLVSHVSTVSGVEETTRVVDVSLITHRHSSYAHRIICDT
jgi:hypothetical protein